MISRPSLRWIASIALLTLTACSEHVADGDGDGDSRPPSLIATVALDVNHVVLVFDEPVTRWSADNPANYRIADSAPKSAVVAAPSDVAVASLHSDYMTVTLTTTALLDQPYVVTVTGVADIHGNVIVRKVQREFDGTDVPDTTPPEVVYRSPAPDAPGISTGTFVAIGFSEAVPPEVISRGLRVHGEGATLTSIRYDDQLHYTCGVSSLQPNTRYTVSLTRVEDIAGNTMPDVQWSFDTRPTQDTTAPTVVESYPTNSSINIPVSADLALTFSEPMDPYSLILRPSVHPDAVQWSHGGRHVTFATDWLPETQYTVQIRPGEMSDAAGNASAQLFTLTFSTGLELETGSFAGTITGDPGSPAASDPTGGIVCAGLDSPQELFTSVAGFVSSNDGYAVTHLESGTYFPFYVKDSDGDGIYQPKYGDALGVYGVTNWFATPEPQTVQVGDGRISGISFTIYDPTAVCGVLNYIGPFQAPIRVGLFDTDGFDPLTSVPVVAMTAQRDGRWDYILNTLDVGVVPDGSYYVAAFLDAGENGVFDPSVDPMGVYGGASPIAIELSHGKDAPETNFELNNPTPGMAAAAIRWPSAPRSRFLERIGAMLEARTDLSHGVK